MDTVTLRWEIWSDKGTWVFELETFRRWRFPGIFFKNTEGRKMKKCLKVCNCREGATQIWKIAACGSRCHYRANLNRPHFGLLFSYFNCMVFAAVRQYFACMSFLFGNMLRISNLRKRALVSSGNRPLPCLLYFSGHERESKIQTCCLSETLT